MPKTKRRESEFELINIDLPCFDDPDDLSLGMALPVRRLSSSQFLVLEPVLFSRRYLRTGDVIEAEEDESGRYKYVRTLRTTPMRGEAFWVSQSQFESESFQALLDEVCEIGGAGEFLGNGILYLELPRSSVFWQEIHEHVRMAKRGNEQLHHASLGGTELMNALMAIYPYKQNGLWVFDDEGVGLDKEPFVSGADMLIDRALEAKGINDGEAGFRLLFSAGEFPDYDFRFTHVREGTGGDWYYSDNFQMEGWLCPALLRYFESAPREVFAKFEQRD